MQKAAFIVFAFTLLIVSTFGWYEDRTDLPDGDAEISCSTSAGSDIGQDLPEQLRSDYLKIPKVQWFRLRGQILRMSYDSLESILHHDDLQRQGNCYFHAISGIETEYIQSMPFPRASSSDSAYNYYFSARMADFNGGIQIQLEWYDENNVLINSTAIQSVPLALENSLHFTSSNPTQLGKIVVNAKTMIIRIHIAAVSGQTNSNGHAIDMINVVFFPDNIPGSGRPGK